MEKLLHYVWKHRLYNPAGLRTGDGRTVEVIDPGLPNTDAGPDFFNAKVKIGGTLWVGNVEIHDRASDWRAHGHDRDGAYDNVVLHVVGAADAQATDSRGRAVAQMQLGVPADVAANYAALASADAFPPCGGIIARLPRLTVSSWMAALHTERLERKTADIARRARLLNGSWEDACFVTLARNYGFGVNADAFEAWAMALPLPAAARHRDDLTLTEALFLGQAGLLDDDAVPPRHRDEARRDGYLARLQAEYAFLAHKFGLKPMDRRLWRFLRLRPQNFPHIRIAQLAVLYHEGRTGLSRLVECASADDVRRLMATRVTPYWQTHYTFGAASPASAKALSDRSLDLIVINTAVPMMFAYGRHTMNEALCDRACAMLESLKPEANSVVSAWSRCGLRAMTAADSQALVQLKREYCDRRDCLRCRFGYEYLKGKKAER